MTILSTSEGIAYTAFLIRQSGVMSDFPHTDEEKILYTKHYEIENQLKSQNKDYRRQPWRSPGSVHVEKTDEEKRTELKDFVDDLLSKRPKDFNLKNEVDNFDPVENFKKSMGELMKKSTT